MKHVVYVASPESQQIHVWQMDYQGALTLLQVVDTPGQGQPMAIHPANTHLYISVRPSFGVVSYHIDERGLLTEAGMAPLPGDPTQLTTDLRGTTCTAFPIVAAAILASAPSTNRVSPARRRKR